MKSHLLICIVYMYTYRYILSTHSICQIALLYSYNNSFIDSQTNGRNAFFRNNSFCKVNQLSILVLQIKTLLILIVSDANWFEVRLSTNLKPFEFWL